MTRRLVLAMSIMAAVVAIALAVPMALLVARDQRNAFIADLEVRTLAAASILASEPQDQWAATVEQVASTSGARVVVVNSALELVADSDNSGLDRTFDRPEIQQALAGSLTSDVRTSESLGTDLRYVAAPVIINQGVADAVRLSLPEDVVQAAVRRTQGWLAVFVVAVMGAAALVALLIARSVTAPLKSLAGVARQLPDDLSRRADEKDGPEEIRDVASALNVTAARLEGMVRRAQQFAADASHHLRTPLAGVRLRLEAIEDISGAPEVVHEAEAATAEVDRLTRRIDQVLALARSDAASVRWEDEDVAAIAAERVDMARAQAQANGVTLTFSAPPSAPVHVPVGTVARAVDELLGNALQYAGARVQVLVARSDSLVRLQVDDDGPGVLADDRERVLERFMRGSTARPGGSGLGLALVRESAQVAGGDVVLAESPSGGLRVEVTWLSPS